MPGPTLLKLGRHFQAQCGDTGIIEMWELKPMERKEHALSGKRQRHVPSWPLLCFQSLWGQTLRATVSLTTIKLNKGGDLSVYKEQLIKKKIPVST